LLRRRWLEIAWVAFAIANAVAMAWWEWWETIPFHFIWVSLTLLYGLRVWRLGPTLGVLGVVAASTGALIARDAIDGTQEWPELTEVPLMSAMFLAMVWHARRRQQALSEVEELAESRRSLLERQEQFLHDASHELRTPVTIARGHLELLRWNEPSSRELAVALDELERIERIVDRLLLLAKADLPDFVVLGDVDLETFLEDVFVRWSEVAPRGWRLGSLPPGTLRADGEALRGALDALLENAVENTEPYESIELAAEARDGGVAITVTDAGPGVDPQALERIFDRFARADEARSRAHGGAGLGLAIVTAIAGGHGGTCTVEPRPRGTRFSLWLPGFEPAVAQTATTASTAERSVVT
jgi:signal transduction histidine kinase